MGVPSGVSGVLLAAGPSSRLGGSTPKQLIEIDGVPLVRRVARQALDSRLDELVVVTGFQAQQVATALAGMELCVVENAGYADGQSSSVRRGLAAVCETSTAALFLPCDQPLLSSGLLDGLINRFEETGGPIVEPAFEGRRGAPVLFARALFPELMAITGDIGGRAILSRHRDEIVQLELDDDRELHDIDTTADLKRLLS